MTLTDLNFPEQFQDLALVVSSGGAVLGTIFGGGTFHIAATPGAYQLTFIATPAGPQQYGLYAVQIANSAPIVTLTASPMTVVTGGVTTLAWTTANATGCTSSGGTFSGNQATGSGSVAVTVTATTTYMLMCTGAGGSTTQQVTVMATPAPQGSGGGGGEVSLSLIAGLLGILAIRRQINPAAH